MSKNRDLIYDMTEAPETETDAVLVAIETI